MPINVRATLQKAFNQLQAERRRIDAQITALEGVLGAGGGRRRRGPPAGTAGRRRRRKRVSADARRAISKRMKAYWAKRKAGGK